MQLFACFFDEEFKKAPSASQFFSFQSIMLPFMRYLADGKEHSLGETIEHISEVFSLSQDEKRELLPSGNQEIIRNRVAWSRTYLGKAKLLDSTRRGYFKIADRGREVLKENPDRIDIKYLERFPEFVGFRNLRKTPQENESTYIKERTETPEEGIASAYQSFRKEVESELLEQVKSVAPSFFERLVIELLVSMGYGGSRRDAGQAVGQSGDGGIDGIIKEDRLGLDVVYIQAKRWEGAVGRPEIQKFAGALQGKRARKGVFITTSNFTREAHDFANSIDSKIVLIDGPMLAGLMIDHDVGVSSITKYEIKRIDSDYFAEG